MFTLKAFLLRTGIVAIASGFVVAVGCQNPDEFYRFGTSGSAGTGSTGAAGDTGGAGGDPAGVAGTGGSPLGTAGMTGVAGTTGAAGTTGVAGTTGAAGTTGTAGTGAAGTGAAGAGGRGGGAAGTGAAGAGGRGGGAAGSGPAGAGGRGGAAGGAAGRGGAAGGAAGAGGGAGGTAGRGADRIQVLAKCQTGTSAQEIKVSFKIFNLESTDKQWSDIKVRYYYTLTMPTVPQVDFDHVQGFGQDRAKLTTMATTSYVEIGFVQSAGVLFAFDNIAGSQEIQLRLSNYSSTMWNTSQTDDYSFVACGAGSTDFVARAKMPGFYMGQLAWGTTP